MVVFPMSRLGWLVLGVVYALHQDVWFWHEARPLVFGVLPVGLAYHGAYCLLVAAAMWWLTRYAWPHHVEDIPKLSRGGAGSENTQGDRRR